MNPALIQMIWNQMIAFSRVSYQEIVCNKHSTSTSTKCQWGEIRYSIEQSNPVRIHYHSCINMKREDKKINSLVCYATKFSQSTYTQCYNRYNNYLYKISVIVLSASNKSLANCRHDSQYPGTNLWSPERKLKAEWDSG